MVPVDLMML